MKIATWNVNSIRTRQPHVIDWLTNNSIDVLCLQETKVIDIDFPSQPLKNWVITLIFMDKKLIMVSLFLAVNQ